MAESPNGKNQDDAASPDRDGGGEGVEGPERDGSDQAAPAGGEPSEDDSSQPGSDSDRNEYGQYEEDWQESEGENQDPDEDYWPDQEQDEYRDDYEYGEGLEGDNPDEDEDEDEYEDEDEDKDEDDGQRKMTLVEHLDELRSRLIRAIIGLAVGMVVALILSQPAIQVINGPFEKAVGKKLTTTKMMDPFTMYLRISLYMGLIISSPWIIYQLWMFVAAGLHKHERKYVVYAVPFSAILFISGAVFFLFYISRMLLGAFNVFNRWMGVEMIVTMDSNVTFMTNMMMVFGFCFQMPIAVLLLGKMGLVTVKSLGRYRKYVIVAILILAAMVTSPSPLDQIALAFPMWLLYELGVLLVYFLVERKHRAEDAAMGYTDLDDD